MINFIARLGGLSLILLMKALSFHRSESDSSVKALIGVIIPTLLLSVLGGGFCADSRIGAGVEERIAFTMTGVSFQTVLTLSF